MKITIGGEPAENKMSAKNLESLKDATEEMSDWKKAGEGEIAFAEAMARQQKSVQVNRPFIITVINRDKKPVVLLSANDMPTNKQIVMSGFEGSEYEDILFSLSHYPVLCGIIRIEGIEGRNNFIDSTIIFQRSTITGSSSAIPLYLADYLLGHQYITSVIEIQLDKPLPIDGITKMILPASNLSDARIMFYCFPAKREEITDAWDAFFRSTRNNQYVKITNTTDEHKNVTLDIVKCCGIEVRNNKKTGIEEKMEIEVASTLDAREKAVVLLKSYCRTGEGAQDEEQIKSLITLVKGGGTLVKGGGDVVEILPVHPDWNMDNPAQGGNFQRSIVSEYTATDKKTGEASDYSITLGDSFTLMLKPRTSITLFFKDKVSLSDPFS